MKKTKLFLVLSSLFLVGGVSMVSTGCTSVEPQVVDVTASYTVKHMKQNLVGDEYTLADTETLQGTAGKKTAGVAKSYEGFEAKSFEQVNIAEDGSTVLVINYDRKTLSVSLNADGGSETSPVSVRYGTKLADVALPTVIKKGFSFVKWVHSDGSDIGGEEIVTNSITLKAVWREIISSYQVKHLQQNLTGSEYTLVDTDNLEGQAYTLTAGVAKTYVGFTNKPFEQVEIAEDGSTVLEIKYDRNLFTVTLDVNGGSTLNPLSVRYNTKVSELDIPSTTRLGYNFVKWTYVDGSEIEPSDVVTANLTLKAEWDPIIVGYSVQHLKQNVTGSEYTVADTDILSGIAYTKTVGVAKTYEGFTVQDFEQVDIAEDGSTVLQIKYNRNLIKVNIDSNGGETKNPLDVRYGTKVADIEAPTVTRTGYNFVKWVYGDDSEIGDTDVLTTEITLKATWEAVVSNVKITGLGIDQELTASYDAGLSGEIQKPEIHAIAKVNGVVTDLDSYDWSKVIKDTEVVYELDQTNGDYDLDEGIATLGDWGNLLYKDTEGAYIIETRIEGNNQNQFNGGFRVVDKDGMILDLVACMNTNGVTWVTAVLGDGSNKQVNLFTPENGLGQEATLPSIPVEYGPNGQFVDGNYISMKMTLVYDADNSKITYSLTNEITNTTTVVIDWTIDDLMTKLELTSFDLSKGVVGFYHRNVDCSMYAGNINYNNDIVLCRHEGGHYAANEPICKPGNKEFYECEKCGEIFMEEPDVGTFIPKDIKDYEGLDENHPAYIGPRHEHGTSGTTINADGKFVYHCSSCGETIISDTYKCSNSVIEDILLSAEVAETTKWLSFDISVPDSSYADAPKDVDGNAWSIGILQKLTTETDSVNGYPFSLVQHPNEGGSYLVQFGPGNAFADGGNDWNHGFKWLKNDIKATEDGSTFTGGKLTMGMAFTEGHSAYGIIRDLAGNCVTTGNFNSSNWLSGSNPCDQILGIRVHRDFTISNVVVSDCEVEHVHKVQANPYVANEGGLVGNECQLCSTELDYTFGANGDDYVDITNWWDRNYVKYISFHVDKPEQLPEYNCQGVGIVDDIEGWAEKSQFRLGISYYQDGRTWYLTYGNFQTFTSFEEAGICGSEPDAFPEDGIDLAYTLAQDESGKYDMTMYYKGGQVTEWTKWRSINNDLESGYFDSYIERIYSKMEMTISNVYCSATHQQTPRESVKTNEFKFLKDTVGSYSYSMDVATNTNGDTDSGLVLKDANGQEIKISVRLQGRHLLCLTAITSDESGDHKLDYFTPYFSNIVGPDRYPPTIEDFNSDKGDTYQRYVVRLVYDDVNKEFSMYLSSTYAGEEVNIKNWTISQLETDLKLSGLDFSTGSVGICARDCGSYVATARNIVLN